MVPEDQTYALNTYVLNLETHSGMAQLFVDGEAVLTVEAGEEGTGEASILLRAGRHELRVEQRHGGGDWTGARLSVSDLSDPTFVPELSPY